RMDRMLVHCQDHVAALEAHEQGRLLGLDPRDADALSRHDAVESHPEVRDLSVICRQNGWCLCCLLDRPSVEQGATEGKNQEEGKKCLCRWFQGSLLHRLDWLGETQHSVCSWSAVAIPVSGEPWSAPEQVLD